MLKKNQNDFRGNIISQLLLLWLEPFIFRGYLRRVRFQDVPNLPTEFQGEVLKEKLQKYWKVQKKFSLFRTIFTQNMMDFFRGGMYLVVANLCELCNIVMGWLILEIAINRDKNDTSMAVHQGCRGNGISIPIPIPFPQDFCGNTHKNPQNPQETSQKTHRNPQENGIAQFPGRDGIPSRELGIFTRPVLEIRHLNPSRPGN